MWAASNQRVEVVEALLAAGASPELTNIFSWGALEYNLERQGVMWSSKKSEAVRSMLLEAGKVPRCPCILFIFMDLFVLFFCFCFCLL